MLRRLFFLFPDENHAQRAVDQLIKKNIPERHMHAITRGVKLSSLPEATERQKKDTAFHVERFLWNANLLVFAVALILLIASLATAEWFWSGFALAMMLITFFAGQQFVVRIPDVHLTEFTDALAHGEILLMVDVSLYRVAEIENHVHQQHPEAVVGGASWTMDAFGI
jgi:hypothetical protein